MGELIRRERERERGRGGGGILVVKFKLIQF